MAYTDLTTAWAYKSLITWQKLDQAADNDALFQARWTGDATDGLIPGPLRVTNNVFIKWRNNAGAADVDGLKLNTSDQLEMGTSLKTPTLTADPTANLEASTKQYVDAGSMRIGLVARISAANATTSYTDVVNLSGKAGRFWGLVIVNSGGAGSSVANPIIDGVDHGAPQMTGGTPENLIFNLGAPSVTTMFDLVAGNDSTLIGAFFRTSLRVQHKSLTVATTTTTALIYERQS